MSGGIMGVALKAFEATTAAIDESVGRLIKMAMGEDTEPTKESKQEFDRQGFRVVTQDIPRPGGEEIRISLRDKDNQFVGGYVVKWIVDNGEFNLTVARIDQDPAADPTPAMVN